MRKSAIAALAIAAGAGIAYCMRTQRGQELMTQIGEAVRELPNRWKQPDTPKMVERALQTSHPDTAMSHAFEEAGAM